MIFYILVFILGAIFGSFLNVVIVRLGTGRTLGGRSMCFNCGKQLRWFELFPVASYMAQGGKCLSCGSKISFQYPAVEILFGLITLLLCINVTNLIVFIVSLIFFAGLTVISVYDYKHGIIPDKIILPLLFITLGFRVYVGMNSGFNWLDLIAGPLWAGLIAGLWVISRGLWIGLGDAKLVLIIGLMLGWVSSVHAVLYAFWIGAILGIFLLLMNKARFTMKSEIPFGPFLALGAFVAFLSPGVSIVEVVRKVFF